LTKPLLASVALWPGSGEDLTSENASVEEKLSKCSRRFEEDNIAEKIAVQVGGGNQGKPTVEEEEEILSSMELDRSDEGVSQPMEELKVDVESRRGKRSSPSTAGGFLGEQKKDEVAGEESCPENKKSRYSAEEEVDRRLLNLERDIQCLFPFLVEVSGAGSVGTHIKAIGRLAMQLQEIKERLHKS